MADVSKIWCTNIGNIGKVYVTNKSNVKTFMNTNVSSNPYTPGNRGFFSNSFNGGVGSGSNTIEYVNISTLSNTAQFGQLTYADDGDGYAGAANSNGASGRVLFAGGYVGGGCFNNIEYITSSTPSNATDFGDLTYKRMTFGSCSNSTDNRGVFGGGDQNGINRTNIMDYVTINSASNATDFGDLAATNANLVCNDNGVNDRGIFGGGFEGSRTNRIQYITIPTTSNTSDFGDLTQATTNLAGTSNRTGERGIFAGGYIGSATNVISYITINSAGNAQDFGDLLAGRYRLAGCSNGTNNRGIFAGSYGGADNVIQYITINSAGNALDFGDTVSSYPEYMSSTSDA